MFTFITTCHDLSFLLCTTLIMSVVRLHFTLITFHILYFDTWLRFICIYIYSIHFPYSYIYKYTHIWSFILLSLFFISVSPHVIQEYTSHYLIILYRSRQVCFLFSPLHALFISSCACRPIPVLNMKAYAFLHLF